MPVKYMDIDILDTRPGIERKIFMIKGIKSKISKPVIHQVQT